MNANEFTIPPLPPAGHPMALACAGVCPDHGDVVVPLGTCWYCRNAVTGPDPWEYRDLIAERRVRVIETDTGEPYTRAGWERYITEGLKFTLAVPDQPRGWHTIEGTHIHGTDLVLHTHARCRIAWMTTPIDPGDECHVCGRSAGVRTAERLGRSRPAYCRHCELPLVTLEEFMGDDDEDDDEDDGDDD